MPTSFRLEFSHDIYKLHLSLTLLTLQILVGTESRCPSEKNDDVETDAYARRLIYGGWLSGSCNLWRRVALLFSRCQKLLEFK
jgi:hypothetical protein